MRTTRPAGSKYPASTINDPRLPASSRAAEDRLKPKLSNFCGYCGGMGCTHHLMVW